MDVVSEPEENQRKIKRRSLFKDGFGLAVLGALGAGTLSGDSVGDGGDRALRGINLGGWLISERWMTPGLFDGVKGQGERAIGMELGAEQAEKRIADHRDTFITESDFAWIAAHGFSFVRLPFGYWLLEEAQGYVTGQEYISKAFEWANKYNLKVILDFHGLQGSQNGNDHSGEAGHVGFYEGNNIDRALSTIQRVTKLYGVSTNLLGIEVINEPVLQTDLTPLIDYYASAYQIVTSSTLPETKVIVSDGFQYERVLKALGQHSFGDQLIVATHPYQLYTQDDKDKTFTQCLETVDTVWKKALRKDFHGQAYVIEWSAVLSQKALEKFDNPMKAMEEYYEQQMRVFGRYAWAHSIWTYKAPGSDWWSFRDLPFAQ